MATWTNEHGVDPALANLIIFQESYDTPACDATVTQLILPPQIAYLRLQHDHEIVNDVGERLFTIMGWLAHEVVSRARVPNSLAEERLYSDINGWRIGAKPDLWRDKEVIDWKVTSTWAFLMGEKVEWEQQLNAYAWFYREHGFDVDKLTIKALLRDWTKSRWREDPENYPRVPFKQIDIPVWEHDIARRYLEERVEIHQQARTRGRYRGCTQEERWARDDSFAVMKPGNKRASRVFPDVDSAGVWLEEKQTKDKKTWGPAFIKPRAGESVRCLDYCDVSPFCAQWKKIQELRSEPEGDDAEN